MHDCDEIMTLGLAEMSYMSIFKDFDETVTYGKDMFYGRIIDDFSILTIESTTADHYDSTLGTGTNDLENDSGVHTSLYSGQIERAFGLFGNSIDTGHITANISGSNFDYESCVEDELLLTCDHKFSVEEELLLIVTLKRMLMMKLILIVIVRRRLMMKLILIVTFVWLRMSLSG